MNSPARMHRAFLPILAASGIAAAATPPPEDTHQLEEITVSARRVEERLLDVPVSAIVLSGARLEAAAVTRWDDLTLPGIKIGAGGVTDVLSIRGIASGINFGFEQSAPVFIDGVWFGSSRASQIGFLDTERVEILKGPQPTYYGKNVIAGAFGIVTRKPQREFSAGLETYHEFEHDETAIGGMLNLPLGGHVSARFAGRWRELAGYMTNSADGSLSPHQRDALGRWSLRWNPVDTLTLDGKLEYSRNLTDGNQTQYVRCVPQAFTTPRLLNPAFEDCRMDSTRGFRYDPAAFGEAMTLFEDAARPGERMDNELISSLIAADWQFAPGYSMKAIVAGYDHDFHAWVKQDHSWNQRSLAAFTNSGRLYSQELRLDSPADGRWYWTAGAYREEVARDNAPFTQLALQVPANQARTTNWTEDSDAWAVFGELGLRLADTVSLRAGGRYTEAGRSMEADLSIYQISPNASAPGTDPWSFAVPASVARTSFISTAQSRRDDRFTPAVSLEWRPGSGGMYYVSWREGFKAGGFSSFLAGPIEELGFGPETVQYLEAGFKLRGVDGTWQVGAAVFDGDYQDLQVSIQDPGTGLALTRNAGSAHSRGFDLEAAWAFARHLQLSAGLAWLDAAYDEFRNAACYPTPAQTIDQGCVRTGGAPLPPDATMCQGSPGVVCAQDLSGLPTSFAPQWSGTVSLQFRRQLETDAFHQPLVLSAGLEVMATGAYYTSINGAPGSTQASFAKLDARIALGSANGGWELALIGRNLTDEIYGSWYEPLVAAGLNTGWFATTARPRQIGVQLRLGL